MYKNFYVDKNLFNFSGQEKESPFCDGKNKKVVGEIKDGLKKETRKQFVNFIHAMQSIQSFKHQLFTIKQKSLTLPLR